MKYRKKPVVIEAMQWDGTTTGAADVVYWVLDWGYTARYHEHQPAWESEDGMQGHPEFPALIAVDTLEGTMFANAGDYIIKDVQGEFYPCKPDIFEQTYEPVEES